MTELVKLTNADILKLSPKSYLNKYLFDDIKSCKKRKKENKR